MTCRLFQKVSHKYDPAFSSNGNMLRRAYRGNLLERTAGSLSSPTVHIHVKR